MSGGRVHSEKTIAIVTVGCAVNLLPVSVTAAYYSLWLGYPLLLIKPLKLLQGIFYLWRVSDSSTAALKSPSLDETH